MLFLLRSVIHIIQRRGAAGEGYKVKLSRALLLKASGQKRQRTSAGGAEEQIELKWQTAILTTKYSFDRKCHQLNLPTAL